MRDRQRETAEAVSCFPDLTRIPMASPVMYSIGVSS